MQTVSTRSLDLLHVWTGSDPAAQVHPAFPILYIVSGTGIAHAGDERGRVSAGDLVVIREMVPHGVANDGDETLRVVGFFCKSEIVSTFEETLQPLGVSVVEMGAPVPA
ncbi:MAG TPA: cupin domain-containing protein [Solirubrobacteraceae bacterium]|nr:cupin domain-containing protein [Solirubrobacteraceae bacterium]